jgi:hypothetical protein
MESIKRFFRDETATAEATSTVVMIAAAGLLLALAMGAWYGILDDTFKSFGFSTWGVFPKPTMQ